MKRTDALRGGYSAAAKHYASGFRWKTCWFGLLPAPLFRGAFPYTSTPLLPLRTAACFFMAAQNDNSLLQLPSLCSLGMTSLRAAAPSLHSLFRPAFGLTERCGVPSCLSLISKVGRRTASTCGVTTWRPLPKHKICWQAWRATLPASAHPHYLHGGVTPQRLSIARRRAVRYSAGCAIPAAALTAWRRAAALCVCR